MFKIFYHPLVVSADIPKLSTDWKKKIKFAIESRLVNHPETYGKPLRRSLHGYWKLRVGDYRVIFRIEKNLVKILYIGHRSIIYERISTRN
jgi:mRNA interferase RelE/StbE